MTPNLFSFATSELSQDAILCWLLAWADDDLARVNPELHGAGRAFVDLLYEAFSKSGRSTLGRPANVTISHPTIAGRRGPVRQLHDADITARVGPDVLVIEDKVGAAATADQLRKYREAFEPHVDDGGQLVSVIVQTGDEPLRVSPHGHGWGYVHRSDLIQALPSKPIDGVLAEIVRYLRDLDATYRAWESVPYANWRDRRTAPQWLGLYRALGEASLPRGYGRVTNRGGQFDALWFGGVTTPEGELYLQLDGASLTVRLGGKDVALVREKGAVWADRVREHGLVVGGIKLHRVARVRAGDTMRVAMAGQASDWTVLRRDGCVDLAATADRLQGLVDDLRAFAAQYGAASE